MMEQLFYTGLGLGIGTLIAYLLRDRWQDNRILRLDSIIEELEEENARLRNTLNGRKGIDLRQEKSERMQSAMMEGMILFKEGKAPADIIKEIGLKYPDIAIDFVKKLKL